MKTSIGLGIFVLAFHGAAICQESYPSLGEKEARKLALSTRATGQVGKSLDLRIRSTDRSYNYKLRATWMTPEVIRANARLLQLGRRLSDEQTEAMVMEAVRPDATIVMVEIDPREGSGVIPRNWRAFLQPRGATPERGVEGTRADELRRLPVLAGAARRDYSYDVFWLVFPLTKNDGEPLFQRGDQEAELVVSIYDKAGKVRWPVPASMRSKAE